MGTTTLMHCRPHPSSILAMVAITTMAVLALGVVPSSGQSDASAPTVPAASAALADAERTQGDLTEELAALETARADVARDLGDRGGRLDRATTDLRRARTGAQSLAILAYITADGGAARLGDTSTADDVYAATLVRDGAGARRQAAAYYRDLRSQADAAVTSTVARLDELDDHIATLRRALDLAVDDVRGAATALELAESADQEREVAVELASLPAAPGGGSTNDGGWTPIGTIPGGPSAQQWAQLRNCESTGNYQAVSSGGAYRGAYQFDLSTWRSMGGSGDPIAASPAEQDHRAQALWQSRGNAPWPVCGRYLR